MRFSVEWDEVTQQLVLMLPGRRISKFAPAEGAGGASLLEATIIREQRKLDEKLPTAPSAGQIADAQRTLIEEYLGTGGKITRPAASAAQRRQAAAQMTLEELGLD